MVSHNIYSTAKETQKFVTVIILNIGTDRSEQTVQTQIRLLLMEQSDIRVFSVCYSVCIF